MAIPFIFDLEYNGDIRTHLMEITMIKAFIPTIFLSSFLFGDNGGTGGGNMTQTFVLIAVAALFFYFILWRPEQKRRKLMQEQRSSMKIGDKVTAMGIVGTVEEVKEETIVLKMIDGSSKIEFLKAAITDVKHPESEAK